MTPCRARRLLHDLGLTPLAIYWVRRSFKDRQLWLPLDAPGALSWYFAHLHHSYSRSWRERIVRAAARVAAGTCAPASLEPWVRCYALVARVGADGARAGAVLEAPGMPREWRTADAIVIAPRLRRVILFPFPQRARRPDAVVKVSRRPEDNERTAQEQRTLAELSARLDDRLRRSVPSALGTHRWGALLVGVESCVPGRVLAHPRHPWTRMAVRTHLRYMRAVTTWLAEFHRQTRVRWVSWDDDAQAELERTLDAYQRVFAATPAERRLFAHVAARGRAVRGTPVPIVWRHGDLNPKNAYATREGSAVVDWEEGREGLPLLDLLFFIEEWLTSFPAPQPAREESSRYAQVVGSPDGGPVSRAVHSALRHYLGRTELAPALYPVLHLLLWTDAALRRFGEAGAAGQDDIERVLVERYRGCVRALAAGHTAVTAAEGGPGEPTTWGGADMTGSTRAPGLPGRAPRVAPRVAICIATCSRLAGLRRLLGGIDRLVFTKTAAPEIQVIVVENGPLSGVRELCAELASMGWPVEYEHEPRRGIAHARNRAVRRARAWADFLAFIDDDEVPEPTWLDELLHVQRTFEADAVVGPLVRSFEEPVPAWVVEGRFFEQKRRATGTLRQRASTNNTLVRAAVFDRVGMFDERFALTGGEDTHFFLRASLQGHRTLWADEAIVREFVPPARATVGWLLRRSFRYGNTWSLCERELWPGRRVRARRLGREVRNIAHGLVALPRALAGGKVPTVRCLRGICEAAGNLSGMMGIRYEEYRPSRWMRVHPNRRRTVHA